VIGDPMGSQRHYRDSASQFRGSPGAVQGQSRGSAGNEGQCRGSAHTAGAECKGSSRVRAGGRGEQGQHVQGHPKGSQGQCRTAQAQGQGK
jgi:hypothetical protein